MRNREQKCKDNNMPTYRHFYIEVACRLWLFHSHKQLNIAFRLLSIRSPGLNLTSYLFLLLQKGLIIYLFVFWSDMLKSMDFNLSISFFLRET